jgi:hypothetical protein
MNLTKVLALCLILSTLNSCVSYDTTDMIGNLETDARSQYGGGGDDATRTMAPSSGLSPMEGYVAPNQVQ